MKESTKKKIVKWFWILLAAPVALMLLLLVIVWLFARIPTIEELDNPDNKLATQVIAEGGEILTTYHIENRTFVGYDELPQNLIEATVATEDVRFYQHSGIDFKSLGRVAFKTLLLNRSSQGGGSTITQQLAKTLYPRSETRSRIPGVSKLKMVWVKLREWITAIKLERNYTKEEIIDMYLNGVFYGSNSFGINTAANTFFGKAPSELKTEESAVLIGMVNKPTRYNPVLNYDKSLERRNFVIGQMAKAGYLTREERDSLQALPIILDNYKSDRTTGIAPYFRDMLRRTMYAEKPRRNDYETIEEFRADSLSWANDPLFGWINKNLKTDGTRYDLDKDGLRIYTTLNYKMQRYAEEAVEEHLSKDLQKAFWKDLSRKKNAPFSNDVDAATVDIVMKQARRWSDRTRTMKAAGFSEADILKSFSEPVPMRVFTWDEPGYRDTVMTPDDSIRYYKSFLRCGFMAMEPGTGRVRAYVGGPNYRYFKFDNISQGRRQVGSTIKPFLYTQAMESGMSPCEQVVNVPQVLEIGGGRTWTPKDPHTDGRTVNLRWGLAQSSNSVAAWLMKQLGPEAMVRMMRKLGVSCPLDPVVSLCVGSADVSVYEMVSAYNTFPSHGVYTSPMFVTRIEDSQGNVLSEFSIRQREAISEITAYKMVNMMQGVVDGGTGGRLRGRYALRGPIAGKTGTTNDNSDGWFIGYTPTITAGVWVGGEDRYVRFTSMALGQGANMALPIWGLWMQKVVADGTLGISPSDTFRVPDGMPDMGCSGFASHPADTESEEYYFD